jgi:hypothetical protein
LSIILRAVHLKLTAVLDLTQEGWFKICFGSLSSKFILAIILPPNQGSLVPMWSAKVSCFPFGI